MVRVYIIIRDLSYLTCKLHGLVVVVVIVVLIPATAAIRIVAAIELCYAYEFVSMYYSKYK